MHTIQKLLTIAALSLLSATTMAQTAVVPVTNPAATPAVDKRQANQEKRIEQGVATGALNEAEAHRLHHHQDKIANAEAKAKADGVVTAKERRKLHKMQDRSSKRIHRQKHDAQGKF
jgi:hypothetical protein